MKLDIDLGLDSDFHELLYAEGGEIEPLAKRIEDGGRLGPETRKWLATYLRNGMPKRPGGKRRQSQIEKEMKVVRVIWYLQYHCGKFYQELRKLSVKEIRRLANNEEECAKFIEDTRGEIKKTAAINLYCDLFEDAIPLDTVRTYLRKAEELKQRRGW